MSEKITGYVLLFAGIMIILVAALNIYLPFSGRTMVPQIFHFSGISLDLSGLLGGAVPAQLMAQVNSNGAKTELISADMINSTANLALVFFLMGFLLEVGFKIASLGVMLLRPVKVELKSETK